LGLKSDDKAGMLARLNAQGVQGLQLSSSWENDDGNYRPLIRRTRAAHVSTIRFGDDSSALDVDSGRPTRQSNAEVFYSALKYR
jgi:hypothetical protein